MTTAREAAEMAIVRAKLNVANCEEHARDVGRRFGGWSPEHIVAREAVREAKARLVKCYDDALAIDRGIPQERTA